MAVKTIRNKRSLESSIEDLLDKLCKEYKIYQHKETGRNGIPDRLLIYDGRHWFVELKRPGGRPTELQEAVARTLRGYGAITLWADDRDSLLEIVSALINNAPPPYDRTYGKPRNV